MDLFDDENTKILKTLNGGYKATYSKDGFITVEGLTFSPGFRSIFNRLGDQVNVTPGEAKVIGKIFQCHEEGLRSISHDEVLRFLVDSKYSQDSGGYNIRNEYSRRQGLGKVFLRRDRSSPLWNTIVISTGVRGAHVYLNFLFDLSIQKKTEVQIKQSKNKKKLMQPSRNPENKESDLLPRGLST